jgi:hypothetical protein
VAWRAAATSKCSRADHTASRSSIWPPPDPTPLRRRSGDKLHARAGQPRAKYHAHSAPDDCITGRARSNPKSVMPARRVLPRQRRERNRVPNLAARTVGRRGSGQGNATHAAPIAAPSPAKSAIRLATAVRDRVGAFVGNQRGAGVGPKLRTQENHRWAVQPLSGQLRQRGQGAEKNA